MNSEQVVEDKLKAASIHSDPDINQAVLHELLDALDQSTENTSQPQRYCIWRTAMKTAIAALVAITLGLVFYSIDRSSVAWGQVLEKIQQADALMVRLRTVVFDDANTQFSPQAQVQWTIFLSEAYGFRMDMYAQDTNAPGKTVSWYVPPAQDTLTMVIPSEKKWLEMPYAPEQTQQTMDKDPKAYLERFLACSHRKLEQRWIDNTRVEGIEVDNPPLEGETLSQAVGRLWVDVETELPLRIEIDGLAGTQTVQWTLDYRWNPSWDADVFEPNIPTNFTHAVKE